MKLDPRPEQQQKNCYFELNLRTFKHDYVF